MKTLAKYFGLAIGP